MIKRYFSIHNNPLLPWNDHRWNRIRSLWYRFMSYAPFKPLFTNTHRRILTQSTANYPISHSETPSYHNSPIVYDASPSKDCWAGYALACLAYLLAYQITKPGLDWRNLCGQQYCSASEGTIVHDQQLWPQTLLCALDPPTSPNNAVLTTANAKAKQPCSRQRC